MLDHIRAKIATVRQYIYTLQMVTLTLVYSICLVSESIIIEMDCDNHIISHQYTINMLRFLMFFVRRANRNRRFCTQGKPKSLTLQQQGVIFCTQSKPKSYTFHIISLCWGSFLDAYSMLDFIDLHLFELSELDRTILDQVSCGLDMVGWTCTGWEQNDIEWIRLEVELDWNWIRAGEIRMYQNWI